MKRFLMLLLAFIIFCGIGRFIVYPESVLCGNDSFIADSTSYSKLSYEGNGKYSSINFFSDSNRVSFVYLNVSKFLFLLHYDLDCTGKDELVFSIDIRPFKEIIKIDSSNIIQY